MGKVVHMCLVKETRRLEARREGSVGKKDEESRGRSDKGGVYSAKVKYKKETRVFCERG